MKCHYTHDYNGNRFLLPGCMGTAAFGIHACTCRNKYSSFKQFEKQEYNISIKDKDNQIKDLENEVFRLKRLLRGIIKNKL